MSNLLRMLRQTWRRTAERASAFTLGVGTYFVFASAVVAALFAHNRPFWLVLREGVLANAVAIVVFAIVLFLEELRHAPARLRDAVANPSVGWQLHIRAADQLQRATSLVTQGLRALVAVRRNGDTIGEVAVRSALEEDLRSFRAIAMSGTIAQGSWRRRRRAKRILTEFDDVEFKNADAFLAAMERFNDSY